MSDVPRYSGFVPGSHAIEGYGKGGFLFANMSHRGSILALPSGVHAWAPHSANEIDEASLAALFAEPSGAVDLLLIGAGARLAPISKQIRAALKRAGVGLELMSTGAATSTYNLLREEKRRVAAGLIAVP
jgi:uncharacterized protein